MTNTELLAALGTLRGQVAQMTPEPWEAAFKDKTAISSSAPPGGLIGEFDCADDNVGVPAIRNVADELIAAVEALMGTQPSHRAPGCWCGVSRDTNYGHEPKCEAARTALDALAKKLEGR